MGGVEARSAELVKLPWQETGAEEGSHAVQHALAPRADGLERAPRQGGRADHRAREHEAVAGVPQSTVPWQDQPWGPLPPKALPNDTDVRGGQAIEFGGEHIEYGYLLQAHTDGDLSVHFLESNVIAAGGVVSSDGWPVIDYKTGGWINGLIDGLRDLIALCDANTKIVPANGPVVHEADLEEQLKMYQTIAQRMSQLLRKGMGPDEVLAAGLPEGIRRASGAIPRRS